VTLKHSRIHAQDCEECETKEGMISKIDRTIAMEGNLDAEQRKKLMGMLAAVVSGLSNLETILPAASSLAKRHVAYGARAEHYPVVGATLLWTLEKGLGEAWTPELATAWTDAYGVLSGYMISEAYGAQPQAAE